MQQKIEFPYIFYVRIKYGGNMMRYEDIKKICDIILRKEISDNKLNVNGYSFGRIRYYNSEFFRNKMKYSFKTSLFDFYFCFISPLCCNGYYDSDIVVIFLDDYPFAFLNPYISFINGVSTIYHESYHAIDYARAKAHERTNEYNNFASDVDKVLKCYFPFAIKYLASKKIHDSFMFEILANLYSVKRVEELIQYIEITPYSNIINNNDYKKLQHQKEKYSRQYENYDLSERLDIMIRQYKKFRAEKSFEKYIDWSIFEIFMNEDGTFKNVKDIVLNDRFYELDQKIIISFFKTKSFVDEIEKNMPSKEEQLLLDEILKCAKEDTMDSDKRIK